MKLISGLFLLSAVFFMSCGDGVPKSTTSLNANEVKAVLNLLSDLDDDSAPDSNEPGKVAINVTHSCDNSGTITSVGQGELQESSTTYSFSSSYTSTFNTCSIDVEGSATPMVLDGQTKGGGKGSITITTVDASGGIRGSLNVTGNEAGTGVCGIDLQISANSTTGIFDTTTTIKGSICGTEVTEADL